MALGRQAGGDQSCESQSTLSRQSTGELLFGQLHRRGGGWILSGAEPAFGARLPRCLEKMGDQKRLELLGRLADLDGIVAAPRPVGA